MRNLLRQIDNEGVKTVARTETPAPILIDDALDSTRIQADAPGKAKSMSEKTKRHGWDICTTLIAIVGLVFGVLAWIEARHSTDVAESSNAIAEAANLIASDAYAPAFDFRYSSFPKSSTTEPFESIQLQIYNFGAPVTGLEVYAFSLIMVCPNFDPTPTSAELAAGKLGGCEEIRVDGTWGQSTREPRSVPQPDGQISELQSSPYSSAKSKAEWDEVIFGCGVAGDFQPESYFCLVSWDIVRLDYYPYGSETSMTSWFKVDHFGTRVGIIDGTTVQQYSSQSYEEQYWGLLTSQDLIEAWRQIRYGHA